MNQSKQIYVKMRGHHESKKEGEERHAKLMNLTKKYKKETNGEVSTFIRMLIDNAK